MDVGDLTEYGLPVPDEGVFGRLRRLGVAPAIVDREVIDAIKARRFEVVAGVESFDASGANLADGERVQPDSVISATGYGRGLEPLVGHLGVLGDDGLPKALGNVRPRTACVSSATCPGPGCSATRRRRPSGRRERSRASTTAGASTPSGEPGTRASRTIAAGGEGSRARFARGQQRKGESNAGTRFR